MHWPEALRPADDRLQDALLASEAYRPDVTITEVLRHVQGRRVTALAERAEGHAAEMLVVKVFHSPRARGNHRRLTVLAAAGLTDLVPVSHGCDPSGHVGVVGHRPGVELQSVPDDGFVVACHRAGVALRRLHESGAELDRVWTSTDEVAHLRTMIPSHLAPLVDRLGDGGGDEGGDDAALVPSHRDCHPRQLVVNGDRVAWIDLDDCTMAPAGLDVGNLLAHLTRERIVERRSGTLVADARAALLDGYGHLDTATRDRWERRSLLRLAALAETRHQSPAERDALLHELGACSA